ncbi:MAG: RHS repeat protein [Prevotellaceae bacterium]|jgi:YD repeat-containing protein|nr:RHS repeat protein [Prevotellaceae bacterium]
MKKKILFIIACMYCGLAMGQTESNYMPNMPTLVPPSPQAAQFNRYGEIPVGHTTGVPQIEIPIYTLNTGWIDIPISISYHASGFRPNEIPSPVGLGWVLNASGVISRSVEGKTDFEGFQNSAMKIKNVAQIDSLKNGTKRFFYTDPPVGAGYDLSRWESWEMWNNLFFNKFCGYWSNVLDTRSDRYYYSFLGNNGNARYNVDTKELTTIPYDPIKIEEIDSIFLITDTKGIKYEFSEIEYCSTNELGTYASSWYLTKIIYPGKESEPIVFSYKKGVTYNDGYSSYSKSVQVFDTRNIIGVDGIPVGLPYLGLQNYMSSSPVASNNPPLLETITWKNVCISISYSNDRADQRKDRIRSLTVKYGNNTVRYANFDNNTYFGTTKDNKRLKLSSIIIKGSNTTGESDKYTFNYYNENSAMPNYELKCHDDYWGYYNGTSSDYFFPNDIDVNQATYNAFISATFPHNVSAYSVNRKSSLEHTKTCVLKEIIYPTKGKTVFEYELNNVPNAYQFPNMTNYNYVGGLRLKQRINYSIGNTATDTKSYSYQGYTTQTLSNDLFVHAMEYIDHYCGLQPGGACVAIRAVYLVWNFVGTSLTSLTGWTGSNVFYNKIKEYKGTLENNDGWTEYYYKEEPRDLNFGCTWNINEYPLYVYSKNVDCDRGNIKSLLDSIIIYNKNGYIVKKSVSQYQQINLSSIHTGVRVVQGSVYPKGFYDIMTCYADNSDRQLVYEDYYLSRIYGINTYAFRDISLLASTTETEYENGQPTVSKTISYGYDVKDGKPVTLTPSSVTQTNSKNEVYTKRTIFPYDDTYKNVYPYNTMLTKNMLDYPIEEKTEKNSSDFVSHIKTSYEQVAGSSLILPKTIFARQTAGVSFEPRIVYQKYDSRGNPLYLTKDDATKAVYIWGYNYQYPIAEIANATYDEVKSALNYTSDSQMETLAAKAEPTGADWNLINNLRTKLSDAQVTVYKYIPLVGRLSVTDPNGNTVYYEYDALNRLQLIKDHDNNILQRYDYNYKQ